MVFTTPELVLCDFFNAQHAWCKDMEWLSAYVCDHFIRRHFNVPKTAKKLWLRFSTRASTDSVQVWFSNQNGHLQWTTRPNTTLKRMMYRNLSLLLLSHDVPDKHPTLHVSVEYEV